MSITGKDSLVDTSGVLVTAHTPSGAGAAGGAWTQSFTGSYSAPAWYASYGAFRGAASVVSSSYQAGSGPLAGAIYSRNSFFFVDDLSYAGSMAVLNTTGSTGKNVRFMRYGGAPGTWNIDVDSGTTSVPVTRGGNPVAFATGNHVMELQRTISGSDAIWTPILDTVPCDTWTQVGGYTGNMYAGVGLYNAASVAWTAYEAGTIAGTLATGTFATALQSGNSIGFSGGSITGGTAPYSSQLQRVAAGAGWGSPTNLGAPVIGPSPALSDTSAVAGTNYDYRYIVTDNTSTTATSSTVTLVAPIGANDTNIVYDGPWNVTASRALTIQTGAQSTIPYLGNSATAHFDTTTIADGIYPIIAYWLDGVGPTRFALDATGNLPLTPTYNGVPSGSPPTASIASDHHIFRWVAIVPSGYPVANSNYTTQASAVKFTSITLAAGKTTYSITVPPKTLRGSGDSVMAAGRLLYVTGSTDGPAVWAPEAGWFGKMADALGMRPFPNAHGGQGVTQAATDGTPATASAFGNAYASQPWTEPAVGTCHEFVYVGHNDGTITQVQWAALITTIRAKNTTGSVLFGCDAILASAR